MINLYGHIRLNTGTVNFGRFVDSDAPTMGTLNAATDITTTTLTLTWSAGTDNVGVTNYKIYKDSTYLATVGNVLTYPVTGLTNGTSYAFNVTALDAGGNESAFSNTINPTTVPVYPTGYLNYVTTWSNGSYNNGPLGASLLLTNTNTSWTANAWFNCSNISAGAQTLFSNAESLAQSFRGFKIYMLATGAVFAEMREDNTNVDVTNTAIAAITQNTNMMLTVKYIGGSLVYYSVNGAPFSSMLLNNYNTVPTALYPMRIGNGVDTLSYGFVGTITKASAWSRGLTDQEVLNLYNSGAGLAP